MVGEFGDCLVLVGVVEHCADGAVQVFVVDGGLEFVVVELLVWCAL